MRTRRAIEVVVVSCGSLLDIVGVKAKIHQDASIVVVVDVADGNRRARPSGRLANALIGVSSRIGR